MRGRALCNSSFESSDHTDFKNIKKKSRRPRGGTLERFDFFFYENDENGSIAPSHAHKQQQNIFSGSLSSKLQNKI